MKETSVRKLIYSRLGLTLGLLCALYSGCKKKEKSKLQLVPDYVHLVGNVTADGAFPAGVNIYIRGEGESLATTSSDGGFGFTVSDARLDELRRRQTDTFERYAKDHFRLYFETTQEPIMTGVSRNIFFSDRGEIDLGTISLTLPVQVSGVVNIVTPEGGFEPGENTLIIAGTKEVRSGEDGKFLIKNLPAGALDIYASDEKGGISGAGIKGEPGKTLELDFPLVLFPADIVSGWVTPLPPKNQDILINSGHPYQRTFVASTSPMVQYFRYHHDRAALESDDGRAPWHQRKYQFSYDFPGGGGHNLYVQFASADKVEVSQILTVKTAIDIFHDTDGFTIADGSGIVHQRNVDLRFTLPKAATRIRCHDDLNQLQRSEFVAASSSIPWVFDHKQNPASQRLTLYCQFADDQLNLSTVYQASALLELFPKADTPVFTIDGGADYTANQLVTLDIKVPDNAYEMRILAEEYLVDLPNEDHVIINIASGAAASLDDREGPWLAPDSVYYHIFRAPGLKKVYIQFRDHDGAHSPVYSQVIRVLPFEPVEAGFLINGGAPSTPLPEVVLTLLPPPDAVAFRFAENTSPVNLGWQEIQQDAVPYRLTQTGQTTLFLEYLDPDGIKSLQYQQTIYFDPFFGHPGGFIIEDGADVTTSPLLNLTIDPPIGAVEMMISDDLKTMLRPGIPILNVRPERWLAVGTHSEFLVDGAGTKTIYLQFRNIDGIVSPMLQRTIIYDPFPPEFGQILLDDGEAVTFDRQVGVELNLPPAVKGMAISHRIDDVSSQASYQEPKAVTTYLLPDASGIYTIYVRYITLDGEESPIYKDDIELVLPP